MLRHIAIHESGLSVVTGEVGLGKTLLARCLLTNLPKHIECVYLSNPAFDRNEILAAILSDLGVAAPMDTPRNKLVTMLFKHTLQAAEQGKRLLLVIDEAHLMPVQTLEEIRLLSNLETRQEKLINIILFGQPELDVSLERHDLRQMRDRVLYHFRLQPMPREDVPAYLDHRMRTAGWRGGEVFSRRAAYAIWQAAAGRHRRINLLADKALLAAFIDEKRYVNAQHVARARAELAPDHSRQTKRRVGMGLGGAIITSMLVLIWLSTQPSNPWGLLDTESSNAQTAHATPRKQSGGSLSLQGTTLREGPIAGREPNLSLASMLERAIPRLAASKVLRDSRYSIQLASIPIDEISKLSQQIPRGIDQEALWAVPVLAEDELRLDIYYGEYTDARNARRIAYRLMKGRYHPMPVASWQAIAEIALPPSFISSLQLSMQRQ